MRDAIKMIMDVINNQQYKVYNVGLSALYDYLYNKKKYRATNPFDIMLITDMPLTEINSTFLNSVINNDKVIIYTEDLEIAVYHMSLEEYFASQFIQNANLAETIDRKFIFDNDISKHINNKEIKINAKHICPQQIIELFEVISILGWNVSKDTLKTLKCLFKNVDIIDKQELGQLLRRLIINNYFSMVLNVMNAIGIFKHCLYSLQNKKYTIIDKLHKNGHFVVETLALLYMNTDIEVVKQELEELNLVTEKEFKYLSWILLNKDLYLHTNDVDMRVAIYNLAQMFDDKDKNIHVLHKFIIKLNRIYNIIHSEKASDINNRMLYNLCCRPYFTNQLSVNVSEQVKEQLIPLLLKEPCYPINNNEMQIFINNHGFGGEGKVNSH